MEHIEIKVRVHLDRLRVLRHNDDTIGGNADEPYLWAAFLRLDSQRVSLASPDTAEVHVHAPSGAHGNLGKPAEGVTSGEWIPIPAEIGTWETALRGFSPPLLSLTQFATLVVAVAALDRDNTTDLDAVGLHNRIVQDLRRRLNTELRAILREAAEAIQSGGELPDQEEIERRLRDQLTRERIDAIVDRFKERIKARVIASIFVPLPWQIAEANADDFIGHAVSDALTFPWLLAHSLTGIELNLQLAETPTEGRYRVTGRVTRRDIKEPPTLGLVRFGDGGLAAYGRSIGKHVFFHRRSARGVWEKSKKKVGEGELSSGPAVAASADGKSVYVFGRGMNNRIWGHFPGSGGWRQMFDRKFSTGAGVACSADGRIVWLAATGEDGHIYLTFNFRSGAGWDQDFIRLDVGESLTSPGLACSANGQMLHLVFLGPDRRVRRSHFEVNPLAKLKPRFTEPLPGENFRSAASVATSADGKIVWVAALGDDRRQRILRIPESPFFKKGEWARFGEPMVSAPALACDRQGNEVHICSIAHSLALQHRFSVNAGDNWSDGWETLEFGAWF